MFSIITMASSTTNPVEIVSAIKVRLLRLYQQVHDAEGSDQGDARDTRITVAERLRKIEDHHHHERDG